MTLHISKEEYTIIIKKSKKYKKKKLQKIQMQ